MIPNSTLFENDADYVDLFKSFVVQIPFLASVLTVTMLIALFGNLFLAFIIIKKSGRRRMSPVQILILHTCAADVMFACCTILPQLAQFLTFPRFYGGDLLCKFVKYFQLVPMYASPYLLIAISVDRYIAICKPLKAYRYKYRLVHWLASGAWAISLITSTPQLVTFEYGPMDNSTIMSCVANMTIEQEKLAVCIFAAMAWLIPSVTVAVLYTFVCVEVWSSGQNVTSPHSKRRRNKKSDGGTAASPSTYRTRSRAFSRTFQKYRRAKAAENGQAVVASAAEDCAKLNNRVDDDESSRKVHNSSLSANKIKTVKLTISIVACNFLLLAPFCLVNVLTAIFPNIIDALTSTCIMLIGNANSCVNPWIYLIFNYKQVYNLLFKRRPDVGRLRYYQSTVSNRATFNESAVVDDGGRRTNLAKAISRQSLNLDES